MNNLEVGNRIVELREAFGITQAKLAKSLGMHLNAISRIERGVVRLTEKNAKMICAIYPVNEEWLLSGEGEMISEDRIDRELTEKYRKLAPDMREIIDRMIDLLIEQQVRNN